MSKLKCIREAAGLSQSQLATASNVSIRVIKSYEQGERDINLAKAIVLYQLSKALKVSIEDLLEI